MFSTPISAVIAVVARMTVSHPRTRVEVAHKPISDRLAPASGDVRARLETFLPSAAFITLASHHQTEPRGQFRCDDALIVAPDSCEQIAAIIRLCAADSIPVVPWSGGTGLVGGQTPVGLARPLILSLERMTRIRSIDTGNRVMTVEAGCILEDIHGAAQGAGFKFPLSLASKGSCRIGGTLATNAGGVHVVRYGTMRDLCLGIEAVLPTGQVWHGLSRLRKDSLGYDLRNLIIGSEGTLGIITAASLKLVQSLRDETAAIIEVSGPEAALALFSLLCERFGEQLSAFELIDGTGFRFVGECFPDRQALFAEPPDWAVLIDVGAVHQPDLTDRLADVIDEAVKAELADRAILSLTQAQRQQFWHFRETIPEANRRIGSVSSHDIAVPIASIPAFIAAANRAVSALGPYRINCFGHMGDGNLHYNVFPAEDADPSRANEKRETIRHLVHDLVRAHDGTISAEHGTGRLNAAALSTHGDPTFLAAMRAIKNALDPHGIMNPGAVLQFDPPSV